MRLFERALRRASLPVAMSRGYNPRPQISLPAPLGVGIRGENEVLDFELSEWVRPEEVKRTLSSHLPEGIELRSLRTVPSKPDRQPRELSYRVPLHEGHPVTPAALQQVRRAREAAPRAAPFAAAEAFYEAVHQARAEVALDA